MKRIKIMLLSFALLTVVGGALAFKAKFINKPICYTTAAGPAAPGVCITTFTLSTPTTAALAKVYYTTDAVDYGDGIFVCTSNGANFACTVSTKLTLSIE